MEGKSLNEFLNAECQIFDFSFAELSMYVILLNTNDEYINKIIKYLEVSGLILKISKKEENTYLLKNLSEIEDLDLHINKNLNRIKINELCSQFLSTHVYLVSKGHQFFILFDWNLTKQILEAENDSRILGVFLNNKEKFLEFLEEDRDMTLINFKKEDVENVSQLFEVEERKDNASQNPEEEENFDKEFDLEEDQEEENTSSKKKKTKKHKKKKPEEYDMEYDSKEEKAKRRRRDDVDESKFLKDVTVFLAKLREAIELDKQYFQSKKPALQKLKLLPEIQKFLANNYCQRLFLQSGGLELLQEWIKKLKDGTYPVFNQIGQMLEVLSNISISLTNLKSCQIGGYVMELSKNKTLPHQIQKKAREIVEKWSRIVWDINTSYCDIESGNIMYEMTFKNRKRRNSDRELDSPDKNSKENIEGEFIEENLKISGELPTKKENSLDIYSHARIPKKGLFDFTKKPTTNLNISRDEGIKMKINYFECKSGGRKKNE